MEQGGKTETVKSWDIGGNKQENTTHTENNQATEMGLELTQMLQLTENIVY